MTQDLPQAYVEGQIADSLNVEAQDIVAAAVLAQEDRLTTVTKFGLTPEEITHSNKQQNLGQFMPSNNSSKFTNLYSVNHRTRSRSQSDSPTAELLQELLELIEDMSYAITRRAMQKKLKSSKFASKTSITSKFLPDKKNKAFRKKLDIEAAKLKALKTLYGEIKYALSNKYTISEEKIERIRHGLIMISPDVQQKLNVTSSKTSKYKRNNVSNYSDIPSI